MKRSLVVGNYYCLYLLSYSVTAFYLSLLHTCVHSILLLAAGECSEAQEAGEVSLRPRVSRRLLLRGGTGIAAHAGWKNSAESCRREQTSLMCPVVFLPFPS